MPPVLPPGFSEARLRSVTGGARPRARGRVGARARRAVARAPRSVRPGRPAAVRSLGGVRPGSVEEIQAVAADRQRPPAPAVDGLARANLGYGGAAPRVRGTVVLELSRMNRVLEVDEELGYALVEPGVTFFDLYEHLRANGHRLWMSVARPGLGQRHRQRARARLRLHALRRPLGRHLRHGGRARRRRPRPHRHGRHDDGTPGTLYKGGYGPSLDGLFLQSNFGVVTKMGLWLMPEPESFRACERHVRARRGLRAMIETLRPLKVGETITGNARAATPSASRRGRRSARAGPTIPPRCRARRSRRWSTSSASAGGTCASGSSAPRPSSRRATAWCRTRSVASRARGSRAALRRERHRGRDRAGGPAAGRHPEHDVLRDPRLAGGRDRPRRVLAAVAAARRGRRPPGADGPVTGAGARLRLQRRADLRHAVPEPHLHDPVRPDRRRADRVARGGCSRSWSARAPPPATASTGRTWSSWTSSPSSTTSTAARSAG